MKKTDSIKRLLALLFLISIIGVARGQEIIPLAGMWQFSTDSTAFMLTEKKELPHPSDSTSEYVMLPGSMLTNGKGDPISVKTQWTGSLYDSSYYFNPYMERYRHEGDMKLPFFLTPERHYVGAAWYQRDIYVPKSWDNQRIMLFLERPHIETTVWVNGKEVGHQMSLSTPHVYDITKPIKTGRRNVITIRVYNGIENVCVGQDSHSVTDQTQGNWNGIAGRLELQARPKHVNIRNVRVYPSLKDQKAHVVVELENHANQYLGDVHIMQIREYGLVYEVSLASKPDKPIIYGTNNSFTNIVKRKSADYAPIVINSASNWRELNGNRMEFDIPMTKKMLPWDEFLPAVYRLTLYAGDDVFETTFGFRDIGVEGRQMTINDHPLFIRGTVENCCFPETGYPPTDEEEWMRVLGTCKDYGINMVRFHSYCPPEAAFSAADRLGIYLQPEGPSWPNHGVKLRRGMSIDQYLIDECKRILDTYGNHPSFVMMAAGNEPAGDWVSYCNDWVKQMHEYDSTKVYCGASVGGGWAWDDGSEYHVKGGGRGLDWDRHAPSSDDDYFEQILHPRNFKPRPTTQPHTTAVANSSLFTDHFSLDTTAAANSSIFNLQSSINNSPIIAHEQGQWCAFPDLKEVTQYTGAYKAKNFEIFADLLRDNGMAPMAKKFLMASGKLQTLCYKYEIERNLRTPDYTGFQLLSLNDYSGQGTALVGPLNVFWREKGYVNDKQWRQFCSAVVPLARFPRFIYTNSDTLKVPLEVYNAYDCNLSEAKTSYYIMRDSNEVLEGGILSMGTIPIGKNTKVGTVKFPLDKIDKPSKLTLVVFLSSKIKNQWDFWVYPEEREKGIVNSEEFPSVGAGPVHPSGILAAATGPVPARNVDSIAAANSSIFNPQSSIHVTDTLDSKAQEVLRKGGKVLLLAAGKVTLGSDVVQHYLPVFWNTSWFKMRPPHTTGAYIDKNHPLFAHGFPTDDWSNLNWWELLNKAQVMNLMELPADYQPPIQPIDTWHISRKLGMLIEARVGKGRLLMTTMDLNTDLDHRIVARQMLKAIVSYMESDDFTPTLELDTQTVQHFFNKQAPAVRMFTNDSPDELKPKI